MSRTQVLLVEDEPSYARFLQEVLSEAEGQAYDVTCVQTLQAALSKLSTAAFEIVLLDLGLPDADGTEALTRVAECAPALPVVVLSARHDLDVAIESMRLGAQEYLVKGQAEHLLLPRAARYAIERKRLQMGVVTARAEAERANAVKDDFLAMLGHELRNPLAPIVAALDLLEQKQQPSMARELTVLRRQVSQLVYLVDDLLDVARIAHGKIELHRSVLDVAEVIQSAIETAAPAIEERRHELTVTVPAQAWFVNGDPARLAQVVANLLTNAAKYSEPGGHIAVSARTSDESVEISVSDDGMGMDEELLGRVFEAFTQGGRTLDRSAGGLGIGLSIVRSIIKMHGGTVSASSAGPGKGSEFRVRLPLERADTNAGAERAPSTPAVTVAASRRVLIVDDNTDGAEMLELGLQALGYSTRVAHDGPQAIAVAREFAPDIALLDIGLPVMDGFELARRLQAELGPQAPLLIAVTGYGQASDHARSRAAGFAHHLVKPIDLGTLGKVLDSTRR